MSQIRCLLAGKKPGVLADIVEQVMRNHLNVEIIERVGEQGNILQLTRHKDFNVIVADFSPSDIPAFCHDLFDEHPSMVIAGLVGDGKRLCILVDDPTPAELTGMIRIAADRNTE